MRATLASIALISTLAFAPAAGAQVPLMQTDMSKETLDIGTSTSEIAITPDFRGADLTVFGTINNVDELLLAIGQYDVVVALEGPRVDQTVRRKERFFGIWVNRRSMTFERMPVSYSLASTRALDQIAQPQVFSDAGLGIDYLPLTPTGYFGIGTNLTEFRESYRRLKRSSGLYQTAPNGVRFVSASLFRATLKLPVNIPDGVHLVHAYLFKTGQLIAQKELPLRVVKTGLEEQITQAAHERSLLYGIFAVLLAIITGWGASLIFRRD